ncbi:MAG: phytoene/squalene synthase family protein [Bacteroidales bacterium]|nr:phytoene/squalene synthase family protein [Bacteroidales bacterium]MCF8375726.1 phytoene/squalene synthase family protein [Bacteroidales bacterium]MCF8400326.1 phytoene/squalene synthase family protein [Bacteroidales bacterium]
MKELYDKISARTSRMTTRAYSTSFSMGIRLFDKKLRGPIYAIYGFVRLADEIVDTFHGFNKRKLLENFRKETFEAIEEGISLNPVINSFQEVVNKYNIDQQLIVHFLNSMEMDLFMTEFNRRKYEEYILGSAEVVGLMCLQVFVDGDRKRYEELKPYAMKLGAAFQKINFLRDLKADHLQLGRAYFPNLDPENFTQEDKERIEKEIEQDFYEGLKGIRLLPKSSRLGVYIAYVYYFQLFRKIRTKKPGHLLEKRVRVPNGEKYSLLLSSYLRHRLDII